ncbi:hypothetical protein RI129_002803 [Pyrocoelia pectoralis]|uniref:NADP-dependent oxidoreductase domain-containing protein n=1 Tax=Pyrocoelia pectoralis TaxID=417401 RepID=A0AAN7VMM3_9COLE
MNISLSGDGKLQMPIIGLGTWRAQDEVQQAVLTALDNGYRHIDTAFVYNNEEAIGNAINSWLKTEGRKREDLFITTKLPNVANRPEDVEKFLRMSLERLQLEYVDLFLIHCPFAFECNANYTPVIEENGNFVLASNNNLAIWEAMEEQVKKGLCKSIGLSNFNMTQVQEIYDAANIKPAVLQIELHAYLQQQDLVKFCRDLNIAVTAYSPLGSPGVNAHFASKYNYRQL